MLTKGKKITFCSVSNSRFLKTLNIYTYIIQIALRDNFQ